MVYLNDLNDDCLNAVLNLLSPFDLFKTRRINKRLNRLANDKIRTNIKAIGLWGASKNFSSCSNHGIVISKSHSCFSQLDFDEKPTKRLRQSPFQFLNVVSACAGVKSIDFGDFDVTAEVVYESFRRCPELECVRMRRSLVKIDKWHWILDKIGHRIVHFKKVTIFKIVRSYDDSYEQDSSTDSEDHDYESDDQEFRRRNLQLPNEPPDHLLIEAIADRCPNIKRVDWFTPINSYGDMFEAYRNNVS